MIGVYDSGFGGLTVLRALRARLPARDFVYLGDSGRAPYGGRDLDTILDFSEQCVERLFAEGCGLVVVACHTVSCVALRHLQRRYVTADTLGQRRILGVTIPAAEAAVHVSRGRIGWLGTDRTVASGTFAAEVAKLGRHEVVQRAAPLLAPLVEEGLVDGDLAALAVRHYLGALADCDTIVLGCTHYPLLADVVRAEAARLPAHPRVLDPSDHVAERLADWLARHPQGPGAQDRPSRGGLRVLCTGDTARFRAHGQRFLGEPLPDVEHVTAVGGRLEPRDPAHAPTGQFVR